MAPARPARRSRSARHRGSASRSSSSLVTPASIARRAGLGKAAPAGRDPRRPTCGFEAEWEDPFPTCTLRPPEDFPDHYPSADEVRRLRPGLVAAETGPDSAIVRSLLVKSCAGWHVRPARREFYDAVRATFPTSRQCSLIRTWASEASIAEIIVAWAERAYTIRQLVAALHRAEFAWPERIREINQWADR